MTMKGGGMRKIWTD